MTTSRSLIPMTSRRVLRGARHWTTKDAAERAQRTFVQSGITVKAPWAQEAPCIDFQVEPRADGGFAISCEHPFASDQVSQIETRGRTNMPCSCFASTKRTYYANIQLYSQLIEGSPAGSAPSLSVKEVTVCADCGAAEFVITEDERRWFRRP